jgi:hypothetical protein
VRLCRVCYAEIEGYGSELEAEDVKALVYIGALLLCVALSAEPLGFFEQKFTSINFDKGKWSRTAQLPCYTYSAKENGATVEVLRLGTSNLVPFRATSGLNVVVCGSTAAFDEGFEAIRPVQSATAGKDAEPNRTFHVANGVSR